MIRWGKREGWLDAPKTSLISWARLNGCQFNSVRVDEIEGKGLAIVAEAQLDEDAGPLIVVPRELILSKETVELHAKTDKHLREVLDALGSFGQTSRGAILVFLLLQATHLCPEIERRIGVSNPLSEYIKYLPLELLPTFWNQGELDLLEGTSLAPASDAKAKSLFREYERLVSATSEIGWCKDYWWDEADGLMSFEDWKHVDAFYRSRALEFPGIGDAMVPCIDMANHASGEQTMALYEIDEAGNGLLILRDGMTLSSAREVTITYGDQKGACEMLFSYGFIEDEQESARDIFLSLATQDDDPLSRAKRAVSSTAPGVRLFASPEGLRWESDYIWLICINEEDGLQIRLAQTMDGEQKLTLALHEQRLDDEANLRKVLEEEKLWNVYQLRAVAMLQDRVAEQLSILYKTDDAIKQQTSPADVRHRQEVLAMRLRLLESDLLERFYEHFEEEKLRLAQTDVVQAYLEEQANQEVEDFS